LRSTEALFTHLSRQFTLTVALVALTPAIVAPKAAAFGATPAGAGPTITSVEATYPGVTP
jgi:hypothetical protein